LYRLLCRPTHLYFIRGTVPVYEIRPIKLATLVSLGEMSWPNKIL
jgi:hypothetical protein